MKVNLNFKQTIILDREDEVPLEERLCRLAATFDGTCHPLTEIQKYFFERKTDPYPNMDPLEAWGQYMKCCKEYQQRMILGTNLDRLRETSRVEVATTWVKQIDIPKAEPVRVVLGDLEKSYSQVEQIARDVANVLVVYTACEKKKQMINGVATDADIVTGLDGKQINEAALYPIEVKATRAFYPYVGGNNTTVRDEIYMDLTNDLKYTGKDQDAKRGKQTALVLYMMDMLASQKIGVAVPIHADLLAIYKKYRWPEMPDKPKLYRFSYMCYRHATGVNDYTQVWTMFLKNRQHTGSGKDNIFSGYSLMDAPPGLAKNLEEGIDIVNCAKMFGYAAVVMHKPNTVLCDILVSSGITVYCQTLGREVQTKSHGVGVYYRGSLKALNWFGCVQKPPEIKNSFINGPLPTVFHDQHTFCYEFLPEREEAKRWYLPSIRAATGLCIKTNQVVFKKYKTSLDDLRARFYSAIFTRVQYPFTRVTFPNVDPMKNFFMNTIVLTRTKDGVVEAPDFLTLSKSFAATTMDPETLKKWEDIPVMPPSFLFDHHRSTIVDDILPLGERVPNSALEAELRAILLTITPLGIREMVCKGAYNVLKIKPSPLLDLYSVLSSFVFFSVALDVGQLHEEAIVTPEGRVLLKGAGWSKMITKFKLAAEELPPESPAIPAQPPDPSMSLPSIYDGPPAKINAPTTADY